MGKPFTMVYCPICGHLHPFNRWVRIGTTFEPRPLAISQESLGRGAGFRTVAEIGDPYLIAPIFNVIKWRVLGTLKNWLDRGWVSRQDLAEISLSHVAPLPTLLPARSSLLGIDFGKASTFGFAVSETRPFGIPSSEGQLLGGE